MRFILAAVKIDPYLSDEPSITPPTPGACIVRLSEIVGIVRRNTPNANGVPNMEEKLASSRKALIEAIEAGKNIGTPFAITQKCRQDLYAHLIEKFPRADAKQLCWHVGAFLTPNWKTSPHY